MVSVIRPSFKPVAFGYIIAAIVFAAAAAAYSAYFSDKTPWLLVIPALLFVFPVKRHIATRLVTLTIGAERLTLDTGLLSKYTRTVDLAKIQDVAVRQSVWQRLINTGDLSLETAGESGMLSMHGIDSPRKIADQLLGLASHAPRRSTGAVG